MSQKLMKYHFPLLNWAVKTIYFAYFSKMKSCNGAKKMPTHEEILAEVQSMVFHESMPVGPDYEMSPGKHEIAPANQFTQEIIQRASIIIQNNDE